MSDFLFSLSIAALGASVTFAASYVRQRIQDERLRRRYPVAGRFITHYEDTEADGVALHKGFTVLRQRGRRVEGTTWEDGQERSWKLSGVVEPGGFVHGVYGAEDPHDSGVGTFFLRIGSVGGDLQGLWSGYDSVDGGIDGGAYLFRRCAADTVRSASSSDLDDVCALMGEELGEQYVTIERLRALTTDEARGVCLVAHDVHGSLLGALTAKVADRETIRDSAPAEQQNWISKLPVIRNNERVLLIACVAVERRFQGRGVGNDLIREGLRWGHDKASAALCVGWTSPQGCHIAGVLHANGFVEFATIERYWAAESEQAGYECPACGNPCACSAAFFQRRLSGIRNPDPAVRR